MSNKLSIIIPILNEEAYIGKLLEHLLANTSSKNNIEILIVDGGSTDGSNEIINSFITMKSHIGLDCTRPDILLLNSPKGRAKQMNLGAKHATGTILYFLHADSFPPPNFDQLIINEVEKGNKAGCFKMKFDSSHWWLQLAGWLTQFSWRACRGGDQSQFITKKLFDDLGDFDERFTIYEDNDLINKLYARKQFVIIQEWLISSCRCYKKNGVWKLQYHFWTIYVKKWFGASAEDLHRYYKKNIA